jgi:hypothetical protein
MYNKDIPTHINKSVILVRISEYEQIVYVCTYSSNLKKT